MNICIIIELETEREGTSVCSFFGSLHLEMSKAVHWNLLVFSKETNLSVCVIVC